MSKITCFLSTIVVSYSWHPYSNCGRYWPLDFASLGNLVQFRWVVSCSHLIWYLASWLNFFTWGPRWRTRAYSCPPEGIYLRHQLFHLHFPLPQVDFIIHFQLASETRELAPRLSSFLCLYQYCSLNLWCESLCRAGGKFAMKCERAHVPRASSRPSYRRSLRRRTYQVQIHCHWRRCRHFLHPAHSCMQGISAHHLHSNWRSFQLITGNGSTASKHSILLTKNIVNVSSL